MVKVFIYVSAIVVKISFNFHLSLRNREIFNPGSYTKKSPYKKVNNNLYSYANNIFSNVHWPLPSIIYVVGEKKRYYDFVVNWDLFSVCLTEQKNKLLKILMV